MPKHLSDMTLEELWQIFPIMLTPHQDCWDRWYEEEKEQLLGLLADESAQVHHIGSTAIPEI